MEIQGVKTAALLHDIGKLAVPEHILSKPGPLTQEEFQKIRVHPQVGAEIISAVPFPYPVAPLILSHHERWDGKGYPQGLKAEEIPLGARILSVVDYFDALTSDRPYHKAMTFDAAVALLQQEAGRALDPTVVHDVRQDDAGDGRSRRHHRPRHAAAALARIDVGSRPARGGLPARKQQGQHGVRRHRARPSRNLRALRNRPDHGHQPRRLGHDGADLVEAVEPRAVLVVRAVPLRRGGRNPHLPLRHGHRGRRHRDDDGARRAGPGRLGRPQPPSARQRAAERRVRGRRHHQQGHHAQVGAGRAAGVQRSLHRHAGGLFAAARFLHRRSPPPARSRERTGLRRHPQFDRVRADAGGFADRPADRPAQHALHVHAPDARAGARRAAQGAKWRCS